jgi:hypothetical protein
MFSKSRYFFIFLFLLSTGITIQLIYINQTKTLSQNAIFKKNVFVKVTSLPDLALSTEANYIRHRSISDIFSIYRDDGTLREYSPSTYTYAPAKGLYEK